MEDETTKHLIYQELGKGKPESNGLRPKEGKWKRKISSEDACLEIVRKDGEQSRGFVDMFGRTLALEAPRARTFIVIDFTKHPFSILLRHDSWSTEAPSLRMAAPSRG